MEMLSGEVDWDAGTLGVEADWPNTPIAENMMVTGERTLRNGLKRTAYSMNAKEKSFPVNRNGGAASVTKVPPVEERNPASNAWGPADSPDRMT